MKTIVLISFAFLFMNFSCQEDVTPQDQVTQLMGRWEWRESSGGIAGNTITPASEGYSKSVEFSYDSMYTESIDGKEVKKIKFRVEQGKSIYSSDSVDLIRFLKDGSTKSFKVSSDTLYLSDELYDGFTEVFVKKKK